MLPEYQVLDNHFIWRTENGVQTLVAYIFDPGEAQIVAGMLNAALGYAFMILGVNPEEAATLPQEGRLIYTWDGETDVSRG